VKSEIFCFLMFLGSRNAFRQPITSASVLESLLEPPKLSGEPRSTISQNVSPESE
jgi:hypothetical protein